MDAAPTPSTDAGKSHLSRAVWLVPAVLIHLLMWLVACGYLYFLVPRYAAQLEDYGAHRANRGPTSLREDGSGTSARIP